MEASHQYKPSRRLHKGRTVRKAAPAPTAGGNSGFYRDVAQVRAVVCAADRWLAEIGQPGRITGPCRRGKGAAPPALPLRLHIVEHKRHYRTFHTGGFLCGTAAAAGAP